MIRAQLNSMINKFTRSKWFNIDQQKNKSENQFYFQIDFLRQILTTVSSLIKNKIGKFDDEQVERAQLETQNYIANFKCEPSQRRFELH